MSPNIDDNNTDRNISESIDKKESKLATLKVAEAEQRDVERKIARVDPEIIERLNITSGDALELTSSERKTTVLSWPAKDTDRGKHLIRIDGYIRNRLSVGINDTVDVKKVDTEGNYMSAYAIAVNSVITLIIKAIITALPARPISGPTRMKIAPQS